MFPFSHVMHLELTLPRELETYSMEGRGVVVMAGGHRFFWCIQMIQTICFLSTARYPGERETRAQLNYARSEWAS